MILRSTCVVSSFKYCACTRYQTKLCIEATTKVISTITILVKNIYYVAKTLRTPTYNYNLKSKVKQSKLK